jgi:Putative DNA-binding domain
MTAGFAAALLDPDRPVPAGLTDPAGRPAGRRFSVYRNNVVASLCEALATGFPALHRQLGDEAVRALAGIFVRAHPPASPLLMFYGAALPGFLERFRPLADRPWLADLARLELALRESYHAADAAALDAAAMSALPTGRLLAARFRVAPALQLLRSGWPVLDLWRADGPLRPERRAQDILILRPVFDPEPHLLPPGSAAFVDALRAGQSLGDAMEAAGPDHPFAETWTRLLTGGALTAIEETTI